MDATTTAPQAVFRVEDGDPHHLQLVSHYPGDQWTCTCALTQPCRHVQGVKSGRIRAAVCPVRPSVPVVIPEGHHAADLLY